MISYSETTTVRVIQLLFLYLTTHLLIRILFSQTLQVDDAEQIRHAQQFALGYPIPQPPLYSWLSWVLFKLFGTGLLVLSLLKYLLIGLTFWTLWLSTRYLFQHPRTRQLALLSLLLMPSFAWHMHQGFTHTILLGLGITATLHALLRLQDNNNPGDYLYLGIAISIGVLAKYSFLLFLIPLLTAALSIELFRKLILHRHITLAIVTVTIATTPHLYWLSQHYQELFPVIDQKLQVTSANSMTEKISGLYHFSLSAMAFVTPWILLIGALTFQQFSLSPARSPATQLLSRFYLILLVGMITAALFITMPHFKVRWFHPLMMLFPLWWLSMTESSSPLSKTRWDWVLRITAAMTLLIIAIRLLQVITGPDLGHYSRLNRPIMETLQQLPLPPRDTLLVTQDEFLGAHLLSFYPENSVAIGATLYDRGKKLSGSCWLLHDNDDSFPSANWLGTTPLKPYVTTVGKVQYRLELGQQPPVECDTIIQPLQISD